MRSVTGRVFSIQRMSTEDGPGIRTTVFFKGCGLRCSWCHNPESISHDFQVQWIGSRCIGCRSCVQACARGALNLTEQGMAVDRGLCDACLECTEACPSTAMERIGQDWTLEDLAAEVEKDRVYFENSGGGVTVSGGEPGLQGEFAAALLQACRARGLHTALDTCGLCPPEALERILAFADMALFDVKCLDSQAHKAFTGSGNHLILDNLRRVRDLVLSREKPLELWIRTPLIPGATAVKDNLESIGRYLADNLDGALSRWELCAFNNLCRDKYTRLGLTWKFADEGLLRAETVRDLEAAAKQSGVDPDKVFATGATRVEE